MTEALKMVTYGDSGGIRCDDSHKEDFGLLRDSGMFYKDQIMTRAAKRMSFGKVLYGHRNWENFNTQEALERAQSSMLRHVMQWINNEDDEDHLAAIVCNAVIACSIEHRIASGEE